MRQKELGPVYAKKEVYPTGSCTAYKTQIDLRRYSAIGTQDGPQDLFRGDCKHSKPLSPTVRMVQQSPFKNSYFHVMCMSILPACMLVYHICAVLQGSEGIRSPGTELSDEFVLFFFL